MSEFDFKKWADSFFAKPKEPMDKETTIMYMTLLMDEMKGGNLTDLKEASETPPVRMVKGRAKALNLELSEHLSIFLGLLTGIPGNLVMYVSALKAKESQCAKPMTLSSLAELFPIGFLTEQALSEAWDEQKLPDNGRNGLDHLRLS